MEEAEPERPEQSGGMLGGEDSVVDGGGVPAEPALSEPEEGGKRMTRRGRRVRRPARYCSTLTSDSASVSSHRMDRWTCPHCRREFNQRTNLRRHLRTACPELVSTRPYSCERGCGSRFYRPDMRDRHQRHCSHTLIGQVQVEDPDALEVFASDEGLGVARSPWSSHPSFLFLRRSPLRRPPECIPGAAR